MRRSAINALIHNAIETCHERGIRLPPFAYWSAEDWAGKGAECDEIRTCRLGWDVTDFGSGDFDRIGLVALTIRNGHGDVDAYKSTTYCEKMLVVQEGQVTPMHCHLRKQEDIICRAGGNLICRVYDRSADGGLSTGDITLSLDGVCSKVGRGHRFVLEPGQSIRLTPPIFHEFFAERGHGTCIVGEVSTVNDDAGDNIFLEGLPRFPAIDEDESPAYLLCTEYG
jgi:D-lyxose ketol-isomerase